MEYPLNKDLCKTENVLYSLLDKYSNFIFLGEAGSGKTELSVNVAMQLAQKEENIHLFDLDQTKPLFRARDVSDLLKCNGVHIHYQQQFQDIPSMVPGIIESLNNDNQHTLVDIGGGVHGAVMAGQLARFINNEKTCVFYTVNVYRPWSSSTQRIADTRKSILDACRVTQVHLIGNPTLGSTTLAEEVISGDRLLDELLGEELHVDYICVAENLLKEVEQQLEKPIIVIRPAIDMLGYNKN